MKVLNRDKSNIREIIRALQGETTQILYDYAVQLPTLKIIEDDQRLLVRGAIKNILQLPKNKDKSRFGIMYRNEKNQIYKKIIIDLKERSPIVDFFFELFIPIVLSTNVNVGKNICVPTEIFKNEAIRRNARSSTLASSASSLAASGAPAASSETALFIKMEVIPYNIEEYLSIPRSTTGYQSVLDIISKVATILHNLEKFSFCHNDLHTGNIMLDEDGNVKLIDFGRSSIFFEGNSYGNYIDNLKTINKKTQTNYRPTSCDMAIFLVDLGTRIRDPTLQAFIRSLFIINDINLFDYTMLLFQRNKTKGTELMPHFLYYPWAVYTDFGNNYTTYNPTWDDNHKNLFAYAYSTGNLKPSNVILRVNEMLARLPPSGQPTFEKIPPPQETCPSWCTWLTCGCLRRRGGTRKRTGKKHNKKGKTKRKQ